MIINNSEKKSFFPEVPTHKFISNSWGNIKFQNASFALHEHTWIHTFVTQTFSVGANWCFVTGLHNTQVLIDLINQSSISTHVYLILD